jgi:hypothetical protein
MHRRCSGLPTDVTAGSLPHPERLHLTTTWLLPRSRTHRMVDEIVAYGSDERVSQRINEAF